jgi:fructose-specific phosphotransferase system IIC component
MLAAVEHGVRADFRVDVVRESGALVAGELAAIVTMQAATAAARRLGLAAGMLGAGAASSTVTFGAGLLAGIAVDVVASRVSHWYYKPQEKIATQVVEALDRMRLLLLHGEAHTGGLRAELERLGSGRATMRQVVLDQLVRQGSWGGG